MSSRGYAAVPVPVMQKQGTYAEGRPGSVANSQ